MRAWIENLRKWIDGEEDLDEQGKLLVQNAGRVVSKGEILEKVWNVSPDTATRAVDNFIVRLRKYIEIDPGSPKHLHTLRAAGYKLTL